MKYLTVSNVIAIILIAIMFIIYINFDKIKESLKSTFDNINDSVNKAEKALNFFNDEIVDRYYGEGEWEGDGSLKDKIDDFSEKMYNTVNELNKELLIQGTKENPNTRYIIEELYHQVKSILNNAGPGIIDFVSLLENIRQFFKNTPFLGKYYTDRYNLNNYPNNLPLHVKLSLPLSEMISLEGNDKFDTILKEYAQNVLDMYNHLIRKQSSGIILTKEENDLLLKLQDEIYNRTDFEKVDSKDIEDLINNRNKSISKNTYNRYINHYISSVKDLTNFILKKQEQGQPLTEEEKQMLNKLKN